MRTLITAMTFALLANAGAVLAADANTLTLVAKDGRFSPEVLEAQAGQRLTLIVRNEGKDAIEFESKPLRKEKVVAAGKEARINLSPLKAGEYAFFDEYHEATGKGRLIIK
jgi:plastocyanin